MRHPFDLDDFESFLSEQADQHRMYPNDKVWHNIQEQIHGKDRWPALTFAAILTGAIIAVVLTLVHPDKELFLLPASNAYKQTNIVSQNKEADLSAIIVANQFAAKAKSIASLAEASQHKDQNSAIERDKNIDEEEQGLLAEIAGTSTNLKILIDTEDMLMNQLENTFEFTEEAKSTRNYNPFVIVSQNQSLRKHVNQDHSVNPTVAYNEVPHDTKAVNPHSATINPLLTTKENIGEPANAAIIKDITANRKNSKWSYQLYATPSSSYRYLLEDKQAMSANNGVPLAGYILNDVNQFVTHKPKLGLEVGGALLYEVADNFRVKAGLQFNYRHFGINAYASSNQPAMLALNRGRRVDSLVRYSNISNSSGYRAIELSNQSFQVSLPVGFDVKMADFNKLDIYLSGSAQLTYQLGGRNYLLSSDYKNYLEQPDLNRNFNMNTAIEAFLSYDAGGVTIQAGPQIRYQMLPGTKEVYPIKEHLIDYGLKVGIIRKLK